MDGEDCEIVVSALGREIERDGAKVEIHIYRDSEDKTWVLKVFDHQGTSTVWDDRSNTDEAALQEALSAFELEGMSPFLTTDESARLH